MPKEKLIHLKQQYATETITEEEQQQIAENIERKQKLHELLKTERELDKQIDEEKLSKRMREQGQSNQEIDLSLPPEDFRPSEENPFG